MINPSLVLILDLVYSVVLILSFIMQTAVFNRYCSCYAVVGVPRIRY